VNIRILKSKEVREWQNMTRHKEVQCNWAKEQESKNIKDASALIEKVRVILNDAIK
jgi:hypothetical protein